MDRPLAGVRIVFRVKGATLIGDAWATWGLIRMGADLNAITLERAKRMIRRAIENERPPHG